MAITAGSTIVSTGNSGNNQSSLVATAGSAVTANTQFLVAIFSTDNDATTDVTTDNVVSGVTDQGGGTWEKLGSFTNGQGAAQAGVTVQLWVRQPGPALNSGQTITFALNNSAARDATAVTIRSFNCASGATITADSLTGTSTQAIDANTLTSGAALAPTSGAGERLRVRACGCESNVSTNITPTASWTAFATGLSGTGTAATECMALGEYIISTTTNQSSDPTHATSGDWASFYVALKENVSDVVSATDLTVGSLALDTPSLVQQHALVATNLTTGSPSLDTPTLPGASSDLTATNVAVGAVTMPTPALVQKQVLTAAALAVGSPVFATPSLGERPFIAIALAVGLPTIGTPAIGQVHALAGVSFAVSGAVIPTPTLISTSLWLNSRVLDFGLDVLDQEVDQVALCTVEPTSYSHATANAIGIAPFSFGPPQNGTGSRRVPSSAVVNDTVDTTGTPVCWAALDSVNSRVLAFGPFDSPQVGQVIAAGKVYNLPTFNINIPR